MSGIAKWAWIVILVIFFCGPYIFAILAADVVVFLLLLWLKPEWLDKL